MAEKTNLQVTFRVSPDLRERIDRAAAQDKRSVSDWVRIHVEEVLDERDRIAINHEAA